MVGVVFDMDDTLYKEREYRLSGYRAVARHFAAVCGLEQDALVTLMAQRPETAFETVEALAKARGVDVCVKDQLTVYRSHRPEITLDAQARQLLTELALAGVPRGIVTDGRAWGQLNKIAALELEPLFPPDCVMATVLHDTDKHSPLPFRMMEERLRRMGATRMMYVGDNPEKDFAHPNLMGWTTVMLMDTENQNIHRQCLQDWPPHHRPQLVVTSLMDIPFPPLF